MEEEGAERVLEGLSGKGGGCVGIVGRSAVIQQTAEGVVEAVVHQRD